MNKLVEEVNETIKDFHNARINNELNEDNYFDFMKKIIGKMSEIARDDSIVFYCPTKKIYLLNNGELFVPFFSDLSLILEEINKDQELEQLSLMEILENTAILEEEASKNTNKTENNNAIENMTSNPKISGVVYNPRSDLEYYFADTDFKVLFLKAEEMDSVRIICGEKVIEL